MRESNHVFTSYNNQVQLYIYWLVPKYKYCMSIKSNQTSMWDKLIFGSSSLQTSTQCIETLNLGHNNLPNEGIHRLKEGLLLNRSLLRLGLQAAKLSCEGTGLQGHLLTDNYLYSLQLVIYLNWEKCLGFFPHFVDWNFPIYFQCRILVKFWDINR